MYKLIVYIDSLKGVFYEEEFKLNEKSKASNRMNAIIMNGYVYEKEHLKVFYPSHRIFQIELIEK